jgi:hypothetical protein
MRLREKLLRAMIRGTKQFDCGGGMAVLYRNIKLLQPAGEIFRSKTIVRIVIANNGYAAAE